MIKNVFVQTLLAQTPGLRPEQVYVVPYPTCRDDRAMAFVRHDFSRLPGQGIVVPHSGNITGETRATEQIAARFGQDAVDAFRERHWSSLEERLRRRFGEDYGVERDRLNPPWVPYHEQDVQTVGETTLIHHVCLDWSADGFEVQDTIRESVKKILDRAEDLSLASVVFPVSWSVYGNARRNPSAEAFFRATLMVAAYWVAFPDSSIRQWIFAVEPEDELGLTATIGRVSEKVDARFREGLEEIREARREGMEERLDVARHLYDTFLD